MAETHPPGLFIAKLRPSGALRHYVHPSAAELHNAVGEGKQRVVTPPANAAPR